MEKDRLEVMAAMIVEAFSPGAELYKHDLGGKRRADFRITDAQGVDIGLLEVTATTRDKRAAAVKAVSGYCWRFKDLRWHWTVHVRDTAEIRNLNAMIAPLLTQLEQNGQTGLWLHARSQPLPGSGVLPPAATRAGIVAACAYSQAGSEGGQVSIAPDIPGGFYSLDSFVPETQAEVNKADNKEKLQLQSGVRESAGDAWRSELFVWLDVGAGQVALLASIAPPYDQAIGRLPAIALPVGITSVWVASGMANWPAPASVLLRCDGNGWHYLTAPALDYDDDQIEQMLNRLYPASGPAAAAR